MRIFLDANILFSAAKSDGAVRRLLTLLIDAGHECWVNSYVLEEARRNLVIKIPENLSALDALLSQLHLADIYSPLTVPKAALKLPEKDRPVLAAAIHLYCDVLVTGDRTHFGYLYGKTIDGVKICSPRLLAETLFPV